MDLHAFTLNIISIFYTLSASTTLDYNAPGSRDEAWLFPNPLPTPTPSPSSPPVHSHLRQPGLLLQQSLSPSRNTQRRRNSSKNTVSLGNVAGHLVNPQQQEGRLQKNSYQKEKPPPFDSKNMPVLPSPLSNALSYMWSKCLQAVLCGSAINRNTWFRHTLLGCDPTCHPAYLVEYAIVSPSV